MAENKNGFVVYAADFAANRVFRKPVTTLTEACLVRDTIQETSDKLYFVDIEDLVANRLVYSSVKSPEGFRTVLSAKGYEL